MKGKNTALKAAAPQTSHRGIHLVHSRQRRAETEPRPAIVPPRIERPALGPRRKRHTVGLVSLAAAAVAAPAVWLGHALLLRMHWL